MRSRLLVLALISVATPAVAAPHATPAPGPVPGAPSLVVTVKDAPTHCGGHDVRVTAKRAKPPLDADFAAAMTIDGPRGLDLDPAHKEASRRSLKRFDDFIDDATKKMAAARDRYEKTFTDPHATAQDKVIAAARIAQLSRRFADVLAFLEIPASVRHGQYAADTTQAFCDAAAEKVEPLDAKADEAARACHTAAVDAKLGPGWWDDVCR